jgi:hypothetical protein
MAIKVKELKDDVLIDVKVNKSFYLMAKAASFHLLKQLGVEDKGLDYVKEIMNKKYEDLNENEKTFYTIILVVAEIERKATSENLYVEKEILEPGDEGYVEPTIQG